MRKIRYLQTEGKLRTRRTYVQQLIGGSKLLPAYLTFFLALAMLGTVPTRAKPLARNNTLWSWVYLVTFSPWLYLFLTPRAWSNLKSTIPSRWKRIGIFATTSIGIAFIYYLAAFGGIPKVLHYADNSDGSIVTTITAKNDWVTRYMKCRPRIAISAVTWDFYGDVCVTRHFFEEVKVGDQVRVVGKVSRYAIEPIHLELVH